MANEEKIRKESSSKICRLCANAIKGGTATNIFNTPDLLQKINYVLPINLNPDEDLPAFMCVNCESKLNAFHVFVCDVVQADKQLRTKDIGNDQVTKAIEEIFGTDSDDELKDLKVGKRERKNSTDGEERKRFKSDTAVAAPVTTKKYTCRRCSKSFPEFSQLLEHNKAIHAGKHIPCPETNCPATAKNEALLREHIQESHSVPVVCSLCNKIFLNQDALYKHQQNKHSSKVCNFCWLSFESESAYELHMYEHNNSAHNQCIYCHKVYQTARGLKRHTLMYHRGEVALLMENGIGE